MALILCALALVIAGIALLRSRAESLEAWAALLLAAALLLPQIH